MRAALVQAGVPEGLLQEALDSLELARQRKRGLLWHKLKARLFKASALAKLCTWESERLPVDRKSTRLNSSH